MKKGELVERMLNYKKKNALKEYLQKHQDFIKSIGRNNTSQMCEAISKIRCKIDFLEEDFGLRDKVKEKEEKQLDKVESEISSGNFAGATELFAQYLKNSYDNYSPSEKTPRCTAVWLIRHYVDMTNRVNCTRSDILAQRLLDSIESYFTEGRCNRKRVKFVTKEVGNELGFNFTQLERLSSIFSELRDNIGLTMDSFLDAVQDMADEKMATQLV